VTGCPGDLLSGLVDGELDHATRERVLSHLLGCGACQVEAETLRAIKTRLSWAGAETPLPSADLAARLLRMAVPGVEPVSPSRIPAGSARPVSVRPAGRAAGSARPRRTSRLRRRTVGGLVALGLSAAFVLGGQSTPTNPQVPVDPGTDQFVSDVVDSTVVVPVTKPVDATVVRLSGR
jgi:anti-sigma factor RsiW